MELYGDSTGIMGIGDFVNVSIPGTYLRRPISVFDISKELLTIVYKIVGKGTEIMSKMESGNKLDILTGLGTGYDILRAGQMPLVVGGGYGTASVYGLAKALTIAGNNPSIILGFNNKEDSFLIPDFLDLETKGASVQIVTMDGSIGNKGLVTDFVSGYKDKPYSYVYACGPFLMLKALAMKVDIQGQFSLESRMGCGFGACMGCSIVTKNGAKRLCKEGPVLDKEEIIWTLE
ncbi:MAG TPA: dihydroorotate dehydrogenase electron transfer subunit [Clostridia bacterium]|nr:dihydroorotate dehydrogenase electron transfer subunit [Clostridia bacterium]